MKKLILVLLISFSGFAQTKHTETNFYLENGKVYWEHVYEVPNKNIDDLIKYFQKEVLTNFKQDNFQLIDNTISFEINDDTVNYKKYGGTNMGTVLFAQYFMKYLVVIDFKDQKYKVIVKEVFLDNKIYGLGHSSGNFSEYITRKSGTAFPTGKLATTGLIYMDKNFLEKFTVSEQIKDKNW
jgi:hypothetical protein